MKKLTLLAVVAVMMLAGCIGENTASKYKNSTREQLNKIIRKVVKNPDNFKINDLETVFSTDSICIMRFNGVGENSWGGMHNSRMEFVMITAFPGTEEQVTMCMLRNLDELQSVLVSYKEMRIDYEPSSKRILTREDSVYYYCGYLSVSKSKKAGYSMVVKDMTKSKHILQIINDSGL